MVCQTISILLNIVLYIVYRSAYEEKVNTIIVELHFEEHYEVVKGGLNWDEHDNKRFIELKIDKRMRIELFKQQLRKVCL